MHRSPSLEPAALIASTPAFDWPRGGAALLLWLLAGATLLLGLGARSVARTQEARVLETAREMHLNGGRQWIVPHVNGRVRLQKPPLAYWLAAGSYKTLHVSEFAGRLPMAFAGWLTLGVAFTCGKWLYDRRTGFIAAAALLGSYLFARWARLAETDILVTCFTTFAGYALWRGSGFLALPPPSVLRGRDGEGAEVEPLSASNIELGNPSTTLPSAPTLPSPGMPGEGGTLGSHSILWFHAAAVAIGLATLAKGPPAAYPIVFFLALCAVERDARPIWRFLLSGAPLTAILVAAPWFLAVWKQPEFVQAKKDLSNSAMGGRGHGGMFWTYFGSLFQATAPWSAITAVSVGAAIKRWRVDRRLRGLLVWCGSIFVPLCVWKNKQFHYLLPLMPPLMLLTAAALTTAWRSAESSPLATLLRRVWLGTVFVCMAGAAGLVVAAKIERGYISAPDVALTALLLGVGIWTLRQCRARGWAEATAQWATLVALAMGPIVTLWMTSFQRADARHAGRAIIAKYGDGPYCFYKGESLSLVFSMGHLIPIVETDAELARRLAENPNLVAIDPGQEHKTIAAPPGMTQTMSFPMSDETWRVYKAP